MILSVLSATLVASRGAAAQEACPNGRISSIFVDNHAIFDPDDLGEGRPLLWAYRLANSLHMRTGEAFLRSELLFREGDCYDPLLLEESERLLRLYGFISTVDVFGLEQPEGSWHVLVDTKDEWTTKLDVRVNLEEGFEFRGVELTEENLLGRGLLLGVFLREEDARRDIGARVFTPRVAGTRLDALVSGGRTRIGRFVEQGLFYPFVGEVGRLAARQRYLSREELFSYALHAGSLGTSDVTHVLLPLHEERVEVSLAGRLGSPGNLTTLGVGVSDESLEFPGFPDAVEVTKGDFGTREPATAEHTQAVAPHTLNTAATRLNVMIGQRNVRFVQRRRLDAISGVQDVAVGTDVGLTLGRSVSALSRGGEGPEDLYARLRFSLGAASPEVVVSSGFAIEGRQVLSGAADEGWRDVIGEFDVRVYWQPLSLPAHTIFGRVEAGAGWNLDQPFQLTLGGGAGVRGYLEESFPGSQRVVASIEDRIAVDWPGAELLDLGITFFADAGRMWAEAVPFGTDSGWKGALGAGLRLGFPAGTRGVIRADLAFPVAGAARLGDLRLRVSLADLLGLAAQLHDRQLDRSRRITVGPDVFTPSR